MDNVEMETSEMLRITNTGTSQFTLTGRLVDGWVDELGRVLSDIEPRTVSLDLRELTFADGRGVTLLRELAAQGADLENATGFVTALVWGDDDDRSH